jgi:hypothetical protein
MMDYLMLVVLVVMLLAVAYNQWRHGIVRTIGKYSPDEEEEFDQTAR